MLMDDSAPNENVAGEDRRGPKSIGRKSLVETSPPPNNVIVKLEKLFKLFADKTRLRILYYLMHEEELDVRTLCGLLRQSQPAVSHHLALLRMDRLIDCRRDGKHNFYRILPEQLEGYLQMLFSAQNLPGPTQGGRICFENFVLSLNPIEHEDCAG